MLRLLVFTCLLGIQAWGQVMPGPYCEINPVTDQGRPVPELPASFQARIETNKVESKISLESYVNYDLPNGRASHRLVEGAVEFISVVDFNTSEVHVVYDKTKCKSSPLDESIEKPNWGKLNINGVNYDYSIMSALKFGKAFGQKYKGVESIRGIPSDHWQSCLHIDNLPANFTVDYYFAVPEWTQTMSASGMPVRAILEGITSEPNMHKFKHVHDFLSFLPYAEKDFEFYQVPEGVFCEGRKTTKSIPKLPESFKYSIETTAPINTMDAGVVTNMELWYDHDHKLARYDFGIPVPLSFTFDYRLGVRYMKNVDEGTCTMVPFQIWVQPPPGSNELWLEMLDPAQIFFLDGTYVYTGKAVQRGIPCDRFISKKTFGPEELTWNATLEYCMIDRNYIELPEDSDMFTTDVPLSMVFRAWDGDFVTRMNHFDFENVDMARDMKMFDVVDCYKPGSKKDIMITFEGNYLDKIQVYKGKFIKDVIARVVKVGEVSPLRVQRPKIEYDVSNIYFTATILDRVPYDVLFKPNDDGDTMGLVSVDDTMENIRQEQDCAEMCQDMRDASGHSIKCNSFAYCFVDNKCLMSTKHVARTGTVDISQMCNTKAVKYYNRAVPAPEFASVRLDPAIRSLKNDILSGNFLVYFQPTDGDEVTVYKASDINTGFIRGDGEGTEKMMKDFHKLPERSANEKYIQVTIDTGLSLDECASSCEHQSTFTCQSFTFCASVGKCFLSAEHPEEHSNMTMNTTQCDVYSRNYIQKFEQKKGVSLEQKDAVTLLKVTSPEKCATLCINQKDFDCKSFDFCPPSSTCRLNKKHLLDFPAKEGKLTPAPQCVHYTRKYIDDFKKTQAGQWIPLKDVNIIRDLRSDECAKSCVEQLGPECKGFDYCGNETFCVLSSDYYREKGVGKVVTQDRAFCAHYTRTSFPDGTRFVPQKVQVNKGYSSGSMAGLGIAMLLIGMVLTVVVVALIYKIRGGSVDNMRVAFSNLTNPQSPY